MGNKELRARIINEYKVNIQFSLNKVNSGEL